MNTNIKIDFFLNHQIGLFVLDELSIQNTSNLITYDEKIAKKAKERGFDPLRGHDKIKNFGNIGFSIHYEKIFNPEFIEKYDRLYNLHPGYLPWGRGRHPTFWALWHHEPAGATIHEITKGLDKGPIVMQELVNKTSNETGYEIFQKVKKAEQRIFKKCLDSILKGINLPTTLQHYVGSYHKKCQIHELKNKEFWSKLSKEEVTRLYRCLDFPGYSNLEDWVKEDKK